MFDQIQACSIASRCFLEPEPGGDTRLFNENEDACCCGRDYLVVIDGATGLEPVRLTDSPTDAAWMAHRLAELLSDYLEREGEASTESLLHLCAERIRAELDAFGYGSRQAAYPSASVAVARIRAGQLECYTLGDITTLLKRADGSMIVFADDTVSNRDGQVLAWIRARSRARGIPFSQAAEQARDMLRKNRMEMNTPEGYWIFEPTGAGIDHGLKETWPLAEITDAALMSDGFSAACGLFQIEPRTASLFDRLRAGMAEDICRRLRALQKEDPTCDRYPRFKIGDDATVVYGAVRP